MKYKIMAFALMMMVICSGTFGHNPPPKKKNPIDSDCTFNGFKMYGKIQFVDVFPDVKVQIVDVFPDLKVQVVDVFPDDCGKWQIVDVFPDTKVQIVDVFPDVKVQYVDVFPGMGN